ncbi:Mak11p Ecym_5635 [Eremothecium cymbalariae DBVPG|uniref:Uncharacterized protein n=1 Tax=Eremothecium cymbalariae (strain CBS 270.75 / DBVPG 7215 / KCTC 17166 / NRRL Y-17582) TaxID=931890 RepID=I6NE79_ERECY|nr:hypothetical protein Ecym_5635 [Eremothecium cymbalariae DBVPG\
MSGNQFRIIVGSYEHNLLCLSLNLDMSEPLFTPIFHFQAHSLSIKCLDISRRYLVSGSNDEHIKIYDLQKRKELGTLFNHNGSITSLKFSRAKDVGGNGTPQNNKWMLSASEDNKIVIWRVKDWENFGILKGHTGRINDLDIHPSNRVAVSVSEDHTIRLWNLMTAKKAAILKLKKYNQNGKFVRWCGNGEFFLVALANKILLYNTATAKVHREIDTGRKTVMHVEVETIDDKEFVCVGLNDGNVQFWETSNLYKDFKEDEPPQEPVFSLRGHSNRVKDFKFYKNEFGHYLVTISSDGKVVVWDLSIKDQLAVYDCSERLNCLAVCNESVEKYDTVKKRTLEASEFDEQSEAEADTEELKQIMLGRPKKKNKSKKKKNKVSIEIE